MKKMCENTIWHGIVLIWDPSMLVRKGCIYNISIFLSRQTAEATKVSSQLGVAWLENGHIILISRCLRFLLNVWIFPLLPEGSLSSHVDSRKLGGMWHWLEVTGPFVRRFHWNQRSTPKFHAYLSTKTQKNGITLGASSGMDILHKSGVERAKCYVYIAYSIYWNRP